MKKYLTLFGLVLVFMVMAMCFMTVFVNASDDERIYYDPDLTYYYTTTVDNPASIEKIMTDLGIGAVDDANGDLSNRVVYVNSGEYINNVLNKPATCFRIMTTYDITFRVFDNSANVSTCVVKVNVIDDVAPVVNRELSNFEFTFDRNELARIDYYQFICDSIKAMDSFDLTALDYDFNSLDTITVDTPSGTYPLQVLISDSSGNTVSVPIEVTVVDTIKPYFTGINGYYSIESGKTLEEVLALFDIKAYDSFGVELEVNLSNVHPTEFEIPGVYCLTFSAKDSLNNVSRISTYIEVIDNQGPVFYFENDTNLVVCSSSMFTDSDILAMLSTKLGRTDFTYEVIEDNYSEHYDEVGNYTYRVSLSFSNGETKEVTINFEVIEDAIKTNVNKFVLKGNIFEKAWQVIKKIGSIFKGIIEWPINRLVSLF